MKPPIRFNYFSIAAYSTICILGLAGFYKLYIDFQVPYARTGLKNVLGFYAFLTFALTGFTGLVLSLVKPSNETRKNTWLLTGSVLAALLFCETLLRALQIHTTYLETRWKCYISPYIRKDTDTLHIIQPYMPAYLESIDFKYPRPRNKAGFRDTDFYPHTDSTLLIQTYGDSFTEGDGSPMDSSYPAVLRKALQRDYGNRFVIQNFGVCGSDPAFSYKQFQHIGLPLKPDVLIVTYCSFDFTSDFFNRSGLDRFKGAYLDCYHAPDWEILYAYSYVFRLFIIPLTGLDYNYSFIDEKTRKARMDELKPKWNETFLRIADLARQNNIRVLLIKKPESSEISNRGYMFDFTFFESTADTVACFKRYDLLPYYVDSAHIDESNIQLYYWPHDGHHNPKGYAVMAKGIYAGLKNTYPDIFPDNPTALP